MSKPSTLTWSGTLSLLLAVFLSPLTGARSLLNLLVPVVRTGGVGRAHLHAIVTPGASSAEYQVQCVGPCLAVLSLQGWLFVLGWLLLLGALVRTWPAEASTARQGRQFAYLLVASLPVLFLLLPLVLGIHLRFTPRPLVSLVNSADTVWLTILPPLAGLAALADGYAS